jgi:hypothetical protein
MNNLSRYKDLDAAIREHEKWPRAMCFGDSWFQYPGPSSIDIQKQLPRLFKKSLFFNEGVAGRDSKSYKAGRDRVASALADYQFNALLLSMGGNDIVGGELPEFIKSKDDPQNIGTRQWGVVPEQVRDHVRLSAFESALMFLRDDYVEMIERRDRAKRDCELIVHTYAYIWPNNVAFKLGPFKGGPWVYPYLAAVGLPDKRDQRVVTCWLIDQFATLLNELASQFPRIRVVDSRDALPEEKSWDNEIHPKGPGFKRIAVEYWGPVLKGVLR